MLRLIFSAAAENIKNFLQYCLLSFKYILIIAFYLAILCFFYSIFEIKRTEIYVKTSSISLSMITICVRCHDPGVISQKKREPIPRRDVENGRYNIWRQRSASFFTSVSGFTNIKIVISRTCCGCLALKRIRLCPSTESLTYARLATLENRTKSESI